MPKGEWYFREEPGAVVGNIGGEIVPLNPEGVKALREVTMLECLGGPKRSYTQKDYEEIESYFSEC